VDERDSAPFITKLATSAIRIHVRIQVRPSETSKESELDLISVQALMRSGSTYFFNVLRRNPSLMCVNEAIMDGKRDYCTVQEASDPPDCSCQDGRQMGRSKRNERSIKQRSRI
jgi:hypothetical protein